MRFSSGELENAKVPIILSSESSANTTCRKFLQFEKALSPIDSTLCGIAIDTIGKLQNARLPIDLSSESSENSIL